MNFANFYNCILIEHLWAQNCVNGKNFSRSLWPTASLPWQVTNWRKGIKFPLGTLLYFNSTSIYLFKVNNGNTRAVWEICSKLTNNSGISIVDFDWVNASWENTIHIVGRGFLTSPILWGPSVLPTLPFSNFV